MLNQLKDLINEVNDVPGSIHDTKIKTADDLISKLDKELDVYKTSLLKEQMYLNKTLKEYHISMNDIMSSNDIDFIKSEYHKLTESIDIDTISMNLVDVIDDIEQIQDMVEIVDTMVYGTSDTLDDMFKIVKQLESKELWELYDTIK